MHRSSGVWDLTSLDVPESNAIMVQRGRNLMCRNCATANTNADKKATLNWLKEFLGVFEDTFSQCRDGGGIICRNSPNPFLEAAAVRMNRSCSRGAEPPCLQRKMPPSSKKSITEKDWRRLKARTTIRFAPELDQINDVPTKEELYPTSQIMAESFFSGAEAARASREIQQGPGSQEWLDLLEEVRREAAEARRRAVEARQSAAEAKRFAAEARRLAAEARKRQTALVQMQFWRERGVLMLRFATSAVIRW